MTVLATIVAGLLLICTGLAYTKLRIPGGFYVLTTKNAALALSPFMTLVGIIGAVSGGLLGHWVVAAAFGLLAVLAAVPSIRVIGTACVLTDALGRQDGGRHLLARRWGLWMPSVPEPRWERDIPFCTPPGCDKPLLCDIWSPPAGVTPSGLAYIYTHGSAWVMLDKDIQTRPFLRRLAGQGHVVMDVAYRLYPQTDMGGMLGDVRRAIAWMKANAATYGVDPNRIAIGGGSAGGHLSLLAAYSEGNPELTPPELQGVDTSVQGVISVYGPVDLAACYAHMNVPELAALTPAPPADWNAWMPPMMKRFVKPGADRWRLTYAIAAGRLDWILGGTPEACPERYHQYSPIAHVHKGCPPTLLMQGVDDLVSPIAAVRRLHQKLQAAGVPAASLELPQTDHAFDLFLFGLSPSARVAMWHTERFLAHIAGARGREQERVAG